MPNSVLRKENFGFYYINYDRLLKKANYRINSQKCVGQPIKKKGQILFFGIENLATLVGGGATAFALGRAALVP